MQTISLKEALLGFRKTLTHLDNHSVTVQRPAGHITQPFDVHVLPGEGMPQYETPSEKGVLRVKLNVAFPSYLTEEQKKEIARLLPE